MTILIERATPADLSAIQDLLVQSNLPQEGLEEHLQTMLVARANQKVVGSAALELYGTSALLRSVTVQQDFRDQGLGHWLVLGILALAREYSLKQIYLLTETAGDFFSRFGFHPIGRSRVPVAVQNSLEFTSLCPDSALAMEVVLLEPE